MSSKEQIIDALKNMTVLELSELVKELEEVFGVSASAPMMMAASPTDTAVAEEKEQTEFNVILESIGSAKIRVIKAVREITGLGLKEAKAVVDQSPKEVKIAIPKEEAEKIKAQLEEAGATAIIK